MTRPRPSRPGRQAHDRGRGGRRAALGHDHRHRRVGEPAQADVAGAGHPAQRPHRPHLVTYGGPDVGLLCAAGKVPQADVRLRVARLASRSSRTSGPPARPAPSRAPSCDEGMLLLGLQAAAWRVPFLPTRVGPRLRPAAWSTPDLQDGALAVPRPRRRRGRGADRRSRPSTSTPPSCHLNRADERGNAAFLGPDLYMDDLFVAGRRRSASCRPSAIVPTERPGRRGRRHHPPAHQPPAWSTGVVEAPNGAHFTECPPDYGRDEAVPEGVRRHGQGPRGVGRVPADVASTSTEADYQAALAARPAEDAQ